jgi:divalent metal cation (Fe/Co/Zn/Cd) transporter
MLGMPLLDPVAALVVAGRIVKAGLETGYQR